MNLKMTQVGAVKYKSLKAAVESYAKQAAKANKTPIPYMTVVMRVRAGMPVAKALTKPLRDYKKA